jgi:hypothetical protein
VKILPNRLKLWLFRRLLDDLCESSGGCRNCEMYRLVSDKIFCSCSESEVLAQAMKVWGKKPKEKKRCKL